MCVHQPHRRINSKDDFISRMQSPAGYSRGEKLSQKLTIKHTIFRSLLFCFLVSFAQYSLKNYFSKIFRKGNSFLIISYNHQPPRRGGDATQWSIFRDCSGVVCDRKLKPGLLDALIKAIPSKVLLVFRSGQVTLLVANVRQYFWKCSERNH